MHKLKPHYLAEKTFLLILVTNLTLPFIVHRRQPRSTGLTLFFFFLEGMWGGVYIRGVYEF